MNEWNDSGCREGENMDTTVETTMKKGPGDTTEEYAEGKRPERRNSKRFDEKLSARIENEPCMVLNVSDKGVLLQTQMPVYFFPPSKTIDFELEVEGEWVLIRGKVMWVQSDTLHSKIGVFIQDAPAPYLAFMQRLYDADQ